MPLIRSLSVLNPTSIGATTPGTGAFTTLSATGTISNTGASFSGSAAAGSLTLNASGNLGVGASAPASTRLYVESSTAITGLLRTTSGTGYTSLRLYNEVNSSSRSLEIDYSGSSYSGTLLTDGPTGESAAITTTGAYPLVLGTANIARVIIDASGNLGLGVTTYAGYGKLQVNTSGTALPTSQSNIPAGHLYAHFYPASSAVSEWLVLRGPYNVAGHSSGIHLQDTFYDNGAYAGKYIQATGQTLVFGTVVNGVSGSSNATLASQMTLDSSGRLLIGTTIGSFNPRLILSGASTGIASIGAIGGGGTGAIDTGISINQTDNGGTLLLIASRNTSNSINTDSAVYIIRFYYDGNNAPSTTYVGGSSNFVTFGVSGSNTLTLTNPGGGNCRYSWFGNK